MVAKGIFVILQIKGVILNVIIYQWGHIINVTLKLCDAQRKFEKNSGLKLQIEFKGRDVDIHLGNEAIH